MNNLPVRQKLMLLAGVPVVGAICLSFLIVAGANEEVRRAESLGSVESLAELSEIIGALVHELQLERTEATRVLGRRQAAGNRDELDNLGAEAATAEHGVDAVGPSRTRREAEPAGGGLERLRSQFGRTDAAQRAMTSFLATRDLSRLPTRLATHLAESREVFAAMQGVRRRADDPGTPLAEITEHYRASLAPLIQATAALTELVDDGELLRLITSLVALMKVKEANAAEHAVVVHALEAGEFAPGAFRDFVTLTTASGSYADVFRTLAGQAGLLDLEATSGKASQALKVREQVSDWLGGPPPVTAERWFQVQGAKLERLRMVERELNERVRLEALSRIDETRSARALGVGLAALVLVVSTALAWYVSVGLLRSVGALRAASHRIGQGDLSTQCVTHGTDELGQLGNAFNEMAREIAAARQAEAVQARMARELEIAARLQSALLPPNPGHPGFEFAGRMMPAEEVGGDFYDVQSGGDNDSLWLTIGDVSNHGLDSGLVMLMAQSAFAAEFQTDPNASADAALRGVNRVLWENITSRLEDNKYVTAQLLQHRGGGRFDCAGGHEPPVVFRERTGGCEVLDAIGPWLGIAGELARVPVSRLELAPGDVLCLYSDGITEARNDNGDLFDTGRLAAALATALTSEPDLELAADHVVAAVEEHAAGRDDDWTMLLVKRSAV